MMRQNCPMSVSKTDAPYACILMVRRQHLSSVSFQALILSISLGMAKAYGIELQFKPSPFHEQANNGGPNDHGHWANKTDVLGLTYIIRSRDIDTLGEFVRDLSSSVRQRGALMFSLPLYSMIL